MAQNSVLLRTRDTRWEMRHKAPAGALGGDYGDFFPQVGEKGRRIRQDSLFRDNFPYLFSNSYLSSIFRCVDWSPHSIDGRNDHFPHFPVGIPLYSIFILFVYLGIYIYPLQRSSGGRWATSEFSCEAG
jgi:hypothetical protein